MNDITDNLKLHKEVLSRLGMEYSGAEIFEDYQGIYDETVKREEREDRLEQDIEGERKRELGRNR